MRGKWQFELSVMHYTKYPPAARELQTLPKTRLLFTRAIEEKFAIFQIGISLHTRSIVVAVQKRSFTPRITFSDYDGKLYRNE